MAVAGRMYTESSRLGGVRSCTVPTVAPEDRRKIPAPLRRGRLLAPALGPPRARRPPSALPTGAPAGRWMRRYGSPRRSVRGHERAPGGCGSGGWCGAVSYTHLRAHETKANLVCRLLLEKKKKRQHNPTKSKEKHSKKRQSPLRKKRDAKKM